MFALLRLQNEFEDIHMLKNTSYKILQTPTDPTFCCEVYFYIMMEDGIYKDRQFVFILRIPKGYPYDPPKVVCKSPIFHPNIDEEGRVCMELCRERWSVCYGVENIFVNIFCILMEPSSENALNVEAGEMMERDYEEFVKKCTEK